MPNVCQILRYFTFYSSNTSIFFEFFNGIYNVLFSIKFGAGHNHGRSGPKSDCHSKKAFNILNQNAHFFAFKCHMKVHFQDLNQ